MATGFVPQQTSKGPYQPSRDPQVLLLVGIVVGVVGLWIFGVMSPATLSDGGGGPVFPFGDQSEDGVVGIELNRTTIDPGEPIEVTVTVDGSPTSDAAVTVGGESFETGDDGMVVIAPSSPGPYEVRATRPDGNRSTTTTVTVRRYRTELELSVPTGRVTNETVPVRVTRADGGPVSATVTVGDESKQTGADGVANFTFETAGTYAVAASKARTEEYVFADASANLTVDRRPVDLVVSTNASEPRVDEPFAVKVVRADTGDRVNATVTAGNRTVATGPNGTATFSFEAAGRVEIRAVANRTPAARFVPGGTRVDVRRIPVDLAVTVQPSPVPEGERATFVVRRTDTGEPVAATLELFGTTYQTGPDGRVAFPFYVPQDVSVRATKPATARERYLPATTAFVVEGPEVVVESLSVPASAYPNETMTIDATLSNDGNVDMDGDAIVTVGNETTRVPTSVARGETTDVAWTVATPNETGNVTVVVAYEEVTVERTVTLERNETNATNTTDETIATAESTETKSTNEYDATNGLIPRNGLIPSNRPIPSDRLIPRYTTDWSATLAMARVSAML